MAQVTSHTLNGVDGSHADGIRVTLTHLSSGTVLFDQPTSGGGRLSVAVDVNHYHSEDTYELVFNTGDYWANAGLLQPQQQIMRQVVMRFCMPDDNARYHMPVIINPNAYSCWWSTPE